MDIIGFGLLMVIIYGVFVVIASFRRRSRDEVTYISPLESAIHTGRGSQPSDIDQQAQEIERLNGEIARIKEAGREIIRQRDQARREAMVAEAEVAALKEKLKDSLSGGSRDPGESDDRFRQAKRAFAQKFHPDRSQATGFDRVVREQVFKEFWGDLERIENRDR